MVRTSLKNWPNWRTAATCTLERKWMPCAQPAALCRSCPNQSLVWTQLIGELVIYFHSICNVSQKIKAFKIVSQEAIFIILGAMKSRESALQIQSSHKCSISPTWGNVFEFISISWSSFLSFFTPLVQGHCTFFF